MTDLVAAGRALADVLTRSGRATVLEQRAAVTILALTDELEHTRADRDLARKAVRAARANSIPREERIKPAPDLHVGGNVA